jgi:hypothetical protein
LKIKEVCQYSRFEISGFQMNDASFPDSKKDARSHAPFLKNIRSFSYFFGNTLPLYAILATVLFIAFPRNNGSSATHISDLSTAAESAKRSAQRISEDASSPPSQQTDKVTDSARRAIEANKDRIESMKENSDKLFSLISAIGALLIFFGFKGLETFNGLRIKAQESVDIAMEAEHRSKIAEDSLNKFIMEKYAIDNNAEINAAQGVALRELAEIYRDIFLKLGKQEADFHDKYFEYLRSSLYYLDKATESKGIDKKIMGRTLIIKGYVLKRLGRIEDALAAVKSAYEEFGETDPAARYNAACYACLLAGIAMETGQKKSQEKYEKESLENIKRTVEQDAEGTFDPANDPDFLHFRKTKNLVFSRMAYP